MDNNSKNKMELISIHVPRTGGTSFAALLWRNYREKLIKIFIKEDGVQLLWQNKEIEFNDSIKALHGHFPASCYLLEKYPAAKMIAWVRDPVDRIISYYYYWKGSEPHGNPNHDDFLKENYSLIEFAQLDYMKNEMLSYFQQVSLNDFFFIGIYENFIQDLKILSGHLNWKDIQLPFENIGSNKKEISKTKKIKLRSILKDDIELYTQVKSMRGFA